MGAVEWKSDWGGDGESPEDNAFGFAPPSQRRLHVNGKQFKDFQAVAVRRQRRSILFLPLFNPLGRVAIAWSLLVTLADFTYTALVVPLQIAFLRPSTWGQPSFLVITDWLGSMFYLCDFLWGFHHGFVVLWDSRWVVIRDGRLVAWYYVRHGAFFVNLAAVVPLGLQIYAATAGPGPSQLQLLNLLFLLRLLRLVRVVSVARALSRPGSRSALGRWLQRWFSPTLLLVFNSMYGLLVMVNLLACVWWAIAEAEGLQNSWAAHIQDKEVDLLTATDAVRYTFSLYFVLILVTTVGWGDIVPYTNTEVLVSLLYLLIGVTLFGYLLTVVSEVISLVGLTGKQDSELRQKVQVLEGWMAGRQLPVWLKARLREHYLRSWAYETEKEEALFYARLPPDLRLLVRDQLQAHTLAASGAFPELSPAARARLLNVISAVAVPITLYPGQELCARGGAARHLFYCDDGRLKATSGPSWAEAVFDGPAVLCLSALFAPHVPAFARHWQTLTAMSGAHLWQVDCSELEAQLMRRSAFVLQELGQAYLERLKELLNRVAGQGWGTPEALGLQQHGAAHLRKAAAGLEAYLATLAGAVAEQQRAQLREAEARQRNLQRASESSASGQPGSQPATPHQPATPPLQQGAPGPQPPTPFAQQGAAAAQHIEGRAGSFGSIEGLARSHSSSRAGTPPLPPAPPAAPPQQQQQQQQQQPPLMPPPVPPPQQQQQPGSWPGSLHGSGTHLSSLPDRISGTVGSVAAALERVTVWRWGEGSLEGIDPLANDGGPCLVPGRDGFVLPPSQRELMLDVQMHNVLPLGGRQEGSAHNEGGGRARG